MSHWSKNMNQQDQIKQLEESNQELKRQIELQAKQIEALKSSSAQSEDKRFAPYCGEGWGVELDGKTYKVAPNVLRESYFFFLPNERAGGMGT